MLNALLVTNGGNVREYVVENIKIIPLLVSIITKQNSSLTDGQQLKILELVYNVTIDIVIDDEPYLIGFVDYLIEITSDGSKEKFGQLAVSVLFNLSHRSPTVRQMILHVVSLNDFGKILQRHGFLGSILFSVFGLYSGNKYIEQNQLMLYITKELPNAFSNCELIHLKYIVSVVSNDAEQFCSTAFFAVLRGLLEQLQSDCAPRSTLQIKCIVLIFQTINAILRVQGMCNLSKQFDSIN